MRGTRVLSSALRSIHGSVLLAVIQLCVEDFTQICDCRSLPQRLVWGTDPAALALPGPQVMLYTATVVWMKGGIVVCNCSLCNRTVGNSVLLLCWFRALFISVYLPLSLIFLVSFFPFPGYNVFTYRCLLALPGDVGPYKQLTTSRYCALC